MKKKVYGPEFPKPFSDRFVDKKRPSRPRERPVDVAVKPVKKDGDK